MPWYAEPSLPSPVAGGAAACDRHTPGSPIYVIGGFLDGNALAEVNAYDTLARTWSPVAPMPTRRGLLGAAVVAGRIHAVGGQKDLEVVDTHEVYDPSGDTWTTAAPMPTARTELAAVTGPDGAVYAIGGSASGFGFDSLSTVEAYDPQTDTWETRAPMQATRTSFAAVTGTDGMIYAIGGWDSQTSEVQATVEVYDPIADSWSSRLSLPVATSGLGAAVGPNGLVIAMGGYRDSPTDSATFSFDSATPSKAWQVLAAMPTPRAYAAVAAGPDGLVYAFGGHRFTNVQDLEIVDVVEAYSYLPPNLVDDVPTLIGRLIGGVAHDGVGGILLGDHFIPIPPRSPLMTAVLEMAGGTLAGVVTDRRLGELAKAVRRESAITRRNAILPRRGGETRS
jgi:N-acetylneuraminic acid mutarotase